MQYKRVCAGLGMLSSEARDGLAIQSPIKEVEHPEALGGLTFLLSAGVEALYSIEIPPWSEVSPDPWSFHPALGFNGLTDLASRLPEGLAHDLASSLAVRGYGVFERLPAGNYWCVRAPAVDSFDGCVSMAGGDWVRPGANVFQFFKSEDFSAFVVGLDPSNRPDKCQPLVGIPMLNLAHPLGRNFGVVFFQLAVSEFSDEWQSEDDCFLIVPQNSSLTIEHTAAKCWPAMSRRFVEELLCATRRGGARGRAG